MTSFLLNKLRRLKTGAPPRVLDVFAGCGGLSLGFKRAGYQILAGIEADPVRARTYGRNLHPEDADRQSQATDICRTTPLWFFEGRELGRGPELVDVIVGGPPCQAYARIGRAKLRHVRGHADAYVRDERGVLYKQYLRFVEELGPLAVLIENVPDILSIGGENVAEKIADRLTSMGYVCRYTLLNAVNYGVPQTRERWFLIGYHRCLNLIPSFPSPSYYCDMPVGFRGTRSHAIRALNGHAGYTCPHLAPLPKACPTSVPAVTCGEALADLPPLHIDRSSGLRRRRDLDEAVPYRQKPQTAYQKLMRTWPGFETEMTVTAHVTRSLPRDYAIFRRMEGGDDYPRALEIAETIFRERLAVFRRKGEKIPEGSSRWRQIRESIVPPYDASKFPNKWRKLEDASPARTLMAHLSHDTYSHIHYDDNEARTISVREAARLQSFPDGFVFSGAMNAAFGQIGNAVPPLLAFELGRYMLRQMRTDDSPGTPRARRRPTSRALSV